MTGYANPGEKVRGRLAVLLSVVLTAIAVAEAQNSELPPLPVDPTPLLELLTQSERGAVSSAHEPKKAVDAYLNICDAHVDAAYKAIDGGDYRTAERELDIYNKASEQAVKVAFSVREARRGLAKKIEQKLFKQIKTLETIERRFPVERLPFADAALDNAKRLRVRALNEAFASGDILKDPSESNENEGTPFKPGPPRISSGRLAFAASSFKVPQRRLSSLGISQIPGDYLSEEEDGHVREAQQIDQRIKVFMKIADRRLAALINSGSSQPADKKAQKKAEEELREWGPLPKAGRVELLSHYARAIEEAIAKLEDAHERNPNSTAIARALTTMRDATDKHLQLLHLLESEMKSEGESVALRRAIEQAQNANDGAREALKSK